MSNNIISALGTQRQFAKQPERVYQKQLITPNFGNGISARVDNDAQLLANSLGLLGDNLLKESIAADKRERAQFTSQDADRMLAGKTAKDLNDFDATQALQHSDKGFDLTDNPYAYAALDKSMGQIVSSQAKEEWMAENEDKVPKSMSEAVDSYNQKLQSTYDDLKGNVHNKYAFDQGFYQNAMPNTLQVAHNANQKINNEARARGQRICSVKYLDLVKGAEHMDTPTFANAFGEITRELSWYSKSSTEALKIIASSIGALVENDVSTEKLNALKDISYFGANRKIGDELPFYKYYKKIAENVNYKVTDDIYNTCKNQDGTINWGKAEGMLGELPSHMIAPSGIPQVELPRYSGDLDNLTADMKGILPSIGGMLAQLGYGDIAEYTSGYRDPQYNREVGGVENSYHTKGRAVDIYVGNLSDEEAKKVTESFSPYFREVLFHDAGSGKHLHLADYVGGLDDKADNTELSAAAYSPERVQTIRKMLKAKDADAQRIVKEKQKKLWEDTVLAATSASTQSEALDIIHKSGLPAAKQNSLVRSINARYKLEASDNLSPLQAYWLKYEKRNLNNDLQTLALYQSIVDDPNQDVDKKLQQKADEASRNVNRYWQFSSGGTYTYKPKQSDSSDIEDDDKETSLWGAINGDSEKEDSSINDAEKESLKNRLKAVVDREVMWGTDQDIIEGKILDIASKYGLDGVELINEWFPPNAIE